jgi:hypothetical protein
MLTVLGEMKEIGRIGSGSPDLWLHAAIAAILFVCPALMMVTFASGRR